MTKTISRSLRRHTSAHMLAAGCRGCPVVASPHLSFNIFWIFPNSLCLEQIICSCACPQFFYSRRWISALIQQSSLFLQLLVTQPPPCYLAPLFRKCLFLHKKTFFHLSSYFVSTKNKTCDLLLSDTFLLFNYLSNGSE